MLSKPMQKQYKKWGTIIVMFYVACFGFLVTHDFQVWILAPFVESLITVFMSAGAIAVITGIILIFQSSIQAEQEKKQEVFKQKLELYKKIIDQLQQAFKVQDNEKVSTITEGEKLELFFTQLNIGLLSKPKTFKSFSKLINDVAEEDGKLKEGASKLLLDFIIDARDDLDVQDDKEKMTDQDKEYLADAIKIAEKQANKAFQKTIFDNLDTMIKDKYEHRKISEKTEEMLKYIYNVLKSNASPNITFKFSPTLLSVKKDGDNYLGIKSSLSFIDIEHILDKTGIEYLKSYNLEITPRSGSSKIYHKVRFQNLTEFKKCEDAIVDYMNS